jgi:hypothetical protein
MHQNPFSPGGYDYSHLERQFQQKADEHEIIALRSTVDRLERSIDVAREEHRSELDGLRSRCERLEALVLELNPGANL